MFLKPKRQLCKKCNVSNVINIKTIIQIFFIDLNNFTFSLVEKTQI